MFNPKFPQLNPQENRLIWRNAPAEDLNTVDEEEDQAKAAREEDISDMDLTDSDRALLKTMNVKQLVAEKRRMQEQARKHLDRSVQQLASRNKIQVNSKEYGELSEKIDKARTPGQVAELQKELEKFQEKKIKEQEESKDKEKILDRNAPELREKKAEIRKLLKTDESHKHLGTNQVDQFIAWCEQAIDAKPSLANAEEVIYKLQNDSKEGIKPREEFYKQTLAPTLRKYNVNLDQAKYLREEGLKERTAAMDKVKEVETMLEGMKQTGLYSYKAKKEILQKMLKGDKMQDFNDTAKEVTDVTRNEARQFTNINSSIFKNTTITVHGVQIRAMSERSTKIFIDYYKDTTLAERKDTVLNWPKIIENEGKLYKELGEIYKDNPEGFKDAAKNFEHLDYKQKEDALKENKKTVENNERQTLKESEVIKNKANVEIEKAKDENLICNKTAKRYKEIFYKDPKHKFTDQKGKIDLKKMQALFDQLTSKKADDSKEGRNLQAYRVQRKEFLDLHAKLEKENPDMDKSELKDLLEDFNESTFKDRRTAIKKLKELSKDEEKERKKEAEVKKAAGVEEDEKLEDLEKLSLEEAMEKALEKVEEGEYGDAMILLGPHWKEKSARTLMDLILTKMKEVQSLQPEEDKSLQQDAEAKADKIIANDATLKSALDEAQSYEAIDEMITRSEDRNNRETDAVDRAESEALKDAANDDEETIIEKFHEGAQDNEMIGAEGTADKVDIIDMSEASSKEDINATYAAAKEEQDRNINERDGTVKFEMRDKNGRTLSRQEREKTIDEQNKEIEEMLAGRIAEGLNDDKEVSDGNYDELARSMAAARAAKAAREDHTETPLRKVG